MVFFGQNLHRFSEPLRPTREMKIYLPFDIVGINLVDLVEAMSFVDFKSLVQPLGMAIILLGFG